MNPGSVQPAGLLNQVRPRASGGEAARKQV